MDCEIPLDRNSFGLCSTQCFVRVERMDEKRMLQYLNEYRLKMTNPLNSHCKINDESQSLTGISVLEKDRKSNSKKQKRRESKGVKEFEDGLKQEGKRKLEEDSETSKPKKKRSEPEVEKNLKPDSYRENDNDWSNDSEKNVQNKLFKNPRGRSLKNSRNKKVLIVGRSLFGSSRDSTKEEGRTDNVDEFKRKRSKRTKPKKTGKFVQKCKKSTMFSGCSITSDEIKTENDTWSDKLDANGSGSFMRNDVEVNYSESCSENGKESVVVQEFAVRRVDVENGDRFREDDYDFREDNSEDDKLTVIFEGEEPEKEKVMTIQKTNFQDVTRNVTPGQRKKRKRKRKRKKKQSEGGIKIFGGEWKNKKDSKSSKFFTEKVMKKTVILPQQKNFEKNDRTIMNCYDDTMNGCRNVLDVPLEISKRTLLNVEDVHKVISHCEIVENTAKHLKESGGWAMKATFPMKGDGKFRGRVKSIKFPTGCSEKTDFGDPDHLKSHSDAAKTNNTGTQVSWVPPLRYFSTGNLTSHPDCVQKAGMNMSAVRRDPRQNYGRPASLLRGTGPLLRSPHIGTQQQSRQTNDYLYSAAINYPPIVRQQQNYPRSGNPPVQTQPVGSPADACCVYNVVPVSYPATQEKIFVSHTLYSGGVSSNPAPRFVHPREGLSSIGPRDPRVTLSISESRDPRVGFSNPGCRDPRVSGKKQPIHSAEPPSQIMVYTSPQSSENLTSAHFVTNPPGENLRKVTSLPVVQPASVQTNNLKWQAIPNTVPNLLRVAQRQPGSKSALPPKNNPTVRAVLTEKPAFENEARSVSIHSLPKDVPVIFNPVLSRSQLKEVTNVSNTGTDSPSSNRASGRGEATAKFFDPTIPQKLVMEGRRLQEGAVLEYQGERAEREGGGKEDEVTVPKGTDRKSSNLENQRTYLCAGDGCKNPGLKVCRLCLSVIYCSFTCQWNHWTVKHKDECYKLKELRG